MIPASEEASVPVFEIDQVETYDQYILDNPLEIQHHLRTLQDRHNFVTVYLDSGRYFFLSTILAVDDRKRCIFLDAPRQPELYKYALEARQSTLTAMLDQVKIQFRLPPLSAHSWENRPVLMADLPTRLLRLQRREFFRINTPLNPALSAKLVRYRNNGSAEIFDFPLRDISGGGICLLGAIEHADSFSLGELFADCRLDIPGESVLSVNLRICEISRVDSLNRGQQLRLGCEFVNLPGTRLTLIERYITRLERERKAKKNGLD